MTLVPFLVIIFRYSDNSIIVIHLSTQKQLCILFAQRTQCSRYFRLTFKKQILNFFFWNSYDFSNINFSLDILVIFIPKCHYKANEYWIDRYLRFDWLLLKKHVTVNDYSTQGNSSINKRVFAESIDRFIVDQAFSRTYDLAPPPQARTQIIRQRKNAWPSTNIQYSPGC